MNNVVVRKYDKWRVAILPFDGIKVEFAVYLESVAQVKKWKDFKIVCTKDDSRTLGIVCKPKTWLAMIAILREKGATYPEGFEDDFMNKSINVLAGKESEAIEHKSELTLQEKRDLDKLKQKVEDIPQKDIDEQLEEDESMTQVDPITKEPI